MGQDSSLNREGREDAESAVSLLVGLVEDFFGRRLVSVVLYGSIVFDDLAPGYGDLDFLAVVDGDLSEDDQRGLTELRQPLRGPTSTTHQRMLEGAFLPRHMLDPAQPGSAFWWGTTGERLWEENRLGWLVLKVIRERGRVVHGQDIRPEIPPASRESVLEEIRSFCRSACEHSSNGGLHSIDWLLTAARLLLLLLLKEARLSSKAEAADWGRDHALGAWRELLPMARDLRLNPPRAELLEIRQWLAGLAPSIVEAANELNRALPPIQ